MMIEILKTEGVVRVRQRTWLVNEVRQGDRRFHSPLVSLSCLDDDAAGEQARVLWAHELDADLVPSSLSCCALASTWTAPACSMPTSTPFDRTPAPAPKTGCFSPT